MTKLKPRILAIDDEKDMLDPFQTILSRKYEVIATASGTEGIEIIKNENTHLVLLDIRMPETNGIEVLKKIKELEPELDVIMVSASKEIKSAVECIKLGAYDYITKPFEIDELKSLMEKALERKELLRENICLKTIKNIMLVS